MVDSMANSVEDYLIDGLSFKLQPGASYVTDRRSVNYYAAGSNVYTSASGARVIRINLTGDGWLDPATVRVVLRYKLKLKKAVFPLRWRQLSLAL